MERASSVRLPGHSVRFKKFLLFFGVVMTVLVNCEMIHEVS